ncbi:MAG: acyl carrier protein [Synechococcales bacterium]|nr:acyl carrier protein [Synechococcales bacterium]
MTIALVAGKPMKSQISPETKAFGTSFAPTEIQTWIINYLAELLEVDPDEIDPTVPFDCYGLDSAVAVGMTGDLEDWLGQRLDPTLLYDYPTVESFAQHLSEELKVAA